MKPFTVRILILTVITLFVLFLAVPDVVQRSAEQSLSFCATTLIPSLFPGFVLSDLLLSVLSVSDRGSTLFSSVFLLPPSAVRCWLTGILAGFPSGADAAVRMVENKTLSKRAAQRALSFVNTPGIVFTVCAVGGGIFGSRSVGLFLWFVQVLATLLVGSFFAHPSCRTAPVREDGRKDAINLPRTLTACVTDSVCAVLNVCGFVVFFRALVAAISYALPFSYANTFLSGLLEMTCGLSRFSSFTPRSAAAASLILGWSGFSVHFQILNVIGRADLSSRFYFPGKFLQSVVSVLLCSLLYPVFFHGSDVTFYPSIGLLIALLLYLFGSRVRKEYFYGKRNI